MKYDELLNHKLFLDCEDKRDVERHNDDCNLLFEKVNTFGGNGAIVKVSSMDEGHKYQPDFYALVAPDAYSSFLECRDLKNGIDLFIHQNQFAAVTYGQNYTFTGSEKGGMVEDLVSFRFLGEKEGITLDDISELSTGELKVFYQDDSHFLPTEKLFEQLRGVKRKGLDEVIAAAETKLGKGGNGKEQERRKEDGPEL